MEQLGIWGALLASGFLGSLGHCLGMCGPLNLMVTTQIRKNDLPALRSFGLYHIARIGVYVLLGALVGGLGSLLGLSRHLTTVGGLVSVGLGVVILLIGASYLGWLSIRQLEGMARWWNTAVSFALKQRGWQGVVSMGVLNGLLPCGLVYSALLLAASSGHVWSGACGMALFGLGTFPALLVLDLGATALGVTHFRRTMLRAAGALMLLVGLQMVLRGGAALHLWPHLQLGRVVLW